MTRRLAKVWRRSCHWKSVIWAESRAGELALPPPSNRFRACSRRELALLKTPRTISFAPVRCTWAAQFRSGAHSAGGDQRGHPLSALATAAISSPMLSIPSPFVSIDEPPTPARTRRSSGSVLDADGGSKWKPIDTWVPGAGNDVFSAAQTQPGALELPMNLAPVTHVRFGLSITVVHRHVPPSLRSSTASHRRTPSLPPSKTM